METLFKNRRAILSTMLVALMVSALINYAIGAGIDCRRRGGVLVVGIYRLQCVTPQPPIR